MIPANLILVLKMHTKVKHNRTSVTQTSGLTLQVNYKQKYKKAHDSRRDYESKYLGIDI